MLATEQLEKSVVKWISVEWWLGFGGNLSFRGGMVQLRAKQVFGQVDGEEIRDG